MTNQRSIFISYRRDDSSDVTGRIYDKLVVTFGHDIIFKDVDNIPFGKDFRQHLNEAVSQCQILLAVIGKDWLNCIDAQGTPRLASSADFVRIEIEAALKRDIPVIPLLVRNANMPQSSQLPECLSSLTFRHGIQIRPDPDFHNDMNRLIKGIQSLFGHLPQLATKKAATSSLKQPSPLEMRRAATIPLTQPAPLEMRRAAASPLTPPAPIDTLANLSIPLNPPSQIDALANLSSRYHALRDHLTYQSWKQADQETYRLMITKVGKKLGEWFSEDDLSHFPHDELQVIDQLWVEYSQGRFGFSVQKKIWRDCGSPIGPHQSWDRFGDRVGWRLNGEWIDYPNLNPSLFSPPGLFPAMVGIWKGGVHLCGVGMLKVCGGLGTLLIRVRDPS